MPEGATRLKATLNATEGLRLQMSLVAAESEGLLRTLSLEDWASGRFLYRDLNLREGTREIIAGISPVASAPRQAEQVIVQVCTLFT